jgi:hypothetical protein
MEVHHHSHTARKKWTHYFWEFIMLFDKILDELNNVNKPTDNPPLRSYDTSLQQDFAYIINQLKESNIIITTRLELLYKKAKNIIDFLKKEYRL